MPKIGAHVSAAGGVQFAPLNAYEEGCECFQFFSRPPQGGPAPILTKEIIQQFQTSCRLYKLESYIHAPYYINLASLNNRIKYGSIQVIREELERGSLLGVKYVLTHLGSAKNYPDRKSAISATIKSLQKVLIGYQGKTEFLIENSAGSGEIIGADFQEIKKIVSGLKKFKVGVCLDVMHAFASGYEPQKLIKKFNDEIGLSYLKLIHANDAKSKLGSRIDRHANIGLGTIGKKNFSLWLKNKKLKKINFILETPAGHRAQDLAVLKQLRKSAK